MRIRMRTHCLAMRRCTEIWPPLSQIFYSNPLSMKRTPKRLPLALQIRADFLALPHLFHYPIRGFLSAVFSLSVYGAPLRMRCRLVPRNTVDTAHCVRHYASGERLGISAQRSSGAALETSVGM